MFLRGFVSSPPLSSCSARHPLLAAPYFLLPSASFCLFSIRCWHRRRASNTTGTVPVWWGGEVRLFYLTKTQFIHIFRHQRALAKCHFKQVDFWCKKHSSKLLFLKRGNFSSRINCKEKSCLGLFIAKFNRKDANCTF